MRCLPPFWPPWGALSMAEELDDPREVPWHPRLAQAVVGHDAVEALFASSLATGKPHHAWLLAGPQGIGKATLAYRLARLALAAGRRNAAQTDHWVAARAHPDLAVLERGFTDSKPKRLRNEITVDDARHFVDFFSRTAGNDGWRVGIVDSADALNTEAANALLKLVEEPPSKCLILIVAHAPGRVLRTLRSRCMRVQVAPLAEAQVRAVIEGLPLTPVPEAEALDIAVGLAKGSPGQALTLLNSEGARSFASFAQAVSHDAAFRVGLAARFSTRAAAVADYDVFMALLLEWVAQHGVQGARGRQGAALAALHAKLAALASVTSGYNLDRRAAVHQALDMVEEALKVA